MEVFLELLFKIIWFTAHVSQMKSPFYSAKKGAISTAK